MNKMTGEKLVCIGGQEYVMRFTWRALGEIETAYGSQPNMFDPEVVAGIAAAGMRGNHQEMTAYAIMEASPPLIPFATAVREALQWAYFGAGEVPDAATEKKKTVVAGWWRRFVSRVRSVFLRLSFGR